MSNTTVKPTPYKAIHLEQVRSAAIMFNLKKVAEVTHMSKHDVNELVRWLNEAYQAGIQHTLNTLEAHETNQDRLSEVGK